MLARFKQPRSLAALALSISDFKDERSKPIAFYESYEPFLLPLAHVPIRLLELGTHRGDSLKVFASYFPHGKIVSVDISDNGIDVSDFPNATFEVADQREADQLIALTERHAPDGWDIIVDDASHYGAWSRLSFDALFPRLKNGGLYIVEDWGTGYWDDWSDGQRYQKPSYPVPRDQIPPRLPSHDSGMVGFVKSLVDEVADKVANDRNSWLAHPATVSSMHICEYFALLKKR